MSSIEDGDTPQGETDIEGGLARTQTYAAVAVAILVIATLVVALTMERPPDEVERSAWAYEMIQMDQVRAMGWTGEGVTVGVIDTGVEPGHPVMRGVEVVAWKDLVLDMSAPYDDDGHGTAMASIIAGRSPLRGGVEDVALVVVKVLDSEHPPTDELIADGIDFCLDPDGDGDYSDGVDVISLSLGGRYEEIDVWVGTRTEAAIAEAVGSGVVIVAAAGNEGTAEDVTLPSRFPQVISVGAVDDRGRLAPFSSPGNGSRDRPDPNKKPEVVCPGVDIMTAWKDGLYAKGSGTSQATALTTAAVAAALSAAPYMRHDGARGGNLTSVTSVKTALMETARPLEGQDVPHDEGAGYGLVQALDLAMALKD